MVLGWHDIIVPIYVTWCDFSKSSMNIWYDPSSYIQFYILATIVSQVVDSNLVFNHNYIYLVQLQFCCRWYTLKMGCFISLTGVSQIWQGIWWSNPTQEEKFFSINNSRHFSNRSYICDSFKDVIKVALALLAQKTLYTKNGIGDELIRCELLSK